MLALSQLKSVKQRTYIKKQIFERYKDNLKNNSKIKFFDIKKNETPWSVDIYLKDVKKLKKILEKNKIFTRYVYPPLNYKKFIDISKTYLYRIFIVKEVYGYHQA